MVLSLLGYIWYSQTTMHSLKLERDNIALDIENENKDATIAAMRAEEAAQLAKSKAINDSLEKLSQRLAKNATARQQTYQSMTGTVVHKADGTGIDTDPLQEKANTGMNKLFTDLQTFSQEAAK